jgi:2-methylisocitrate lyase-like PEP mutase family enzyme
MSEWNKKINNIPVIIVLTTYFFSYQELVSSGVSMIIFDNHNIKLSINAMENVCENIFKNKSIKDLDNIVDVTHIFNLQN